MSNNITITGRLAKDPELRFASTGTAMCTVVVPDQKRVKNAQTNEWEDKSATTWFRATVWRDAAEALAEHARKGDEVTITGRLITTEWTNKEGEVKSSLEVDFATVAIVPRQPQAQRVQSPQGADDPWTQPVQQGRANPSSAWGNQPAQQQQAQWGQEPPF